MSSTPGNATSCTDIEEVNRPRRSGRAHGTPNYNIKVHDSYDQAIRPAYYARQKGLPKPSQRRPPRYFPSEASVPTGQSSLYSRAYRSDSSSATASVELLDDDQPAQREPDPKAIRKSGRGAACMIPPGYYCRKWHPQDGKIPGTRKRKYKEHRSTPAEAALPGGGGILVPAIDSDQRVPTKRRRARSSTETLGPFSLPSDESGDSEGTCTTITLPISPTLAPTTNAAQEQHITDRFEVVSDTTLTEDEDDEAISDLRALDEEIPDGRQEIWQTEDHQKRLQDANAEKAFVVDAAYHDGTPVLSIEARETDFPFDGNQTPQQQTQEYHIDVAVASTPKGHADDKASSRHRNSAQHALSGLLEQGYDPSELITDLFQMIGGAGVIPSSTADSFSVPLHEGRRTPSSSSIFSAPSSHGPLANSTQLPATSQSSTQQSSSSASLHSHTSRRPASTESRRSTGRPSQLGIRPDFASSR
ncbi:hypothetical protein CAC42_5312 [Sphaceloma murrayae]|uniref:Uncharacterized protein n=1 Tax=Sphaceloma murrayae TaxID=2082308 RepID=A0A2K1QV60_9PEZI|nr:hypothetical protein CAC42_5312 [Sphaceloma murrayae]